MSIWRPSETIRVKVLGIAWKAQSLLAAEIGDDNGKITGVRPLGGSIDLGETKEEALHREFQEELKTDITITGPWHVFENIYEHEKCLGHEIIFATDIKLADLSLYEQTEISFHEDNGTHVTAKWFNPNELKVQGFELYPSGLKEYLNWGPLR